MSDFLKRRIRMTCERNSKEKKEKKESGIELY